MIDYNSAAASACPDFRPRKGDTLAIVSSNMDTTAYSTCEIESFTNTNILKCKDADL